jgi:2-dehydropantoate 2-reductase
MRFICFGTGAIGTYIGGSLGLSGNDVVFIERPEVVGAVRQRGLSLELKDGQHHLANPQVVENPSIALETGPFDACILAVKAFDTAAVLESLKPVLADMPPVLSFQNGVENEPLLASVLGKERVIPGTVTTAVGRKGPGDIVVERLRGIGISVLHPLGPALIEAADHAGLRARAFSNPAAMKWSKMLTNLIANASSAILDMTPAQIFANPGLYQMEIRMLRETLRVMRAQNIPVVDLPSTPVRLLAWVIQNLPLSISRPLLTRSVGAGRGAKMPSFHIDLYGGRGKSEVDYLNGAVVRYGDKFHVPTPVNKILNEILSGMTNNQIPREAYAHQPEKLLSILPKE